MALTPAEKMARYSLATGVAVLGLKTLAWRLTGSVALLSDALESIVNVVASLAMAVAVSISQAPPDDDHPFGHGKAEYLSAVLEGVLIVVAAGMSVFAAAGRILHPRPLEAVTVGALVSAAATGLNGLLAWRLMAVGRRVQSPALMADGKHIVSDVITTAGVLLGVLVARLTGRWVLDPLLAIAVALNIVSMGWHLIRESIGGLMDEVLDPAVVTALRAKAEASARAAGATGIEALRWRRAGPYTWLAAVVRVPGAMRVDAAHAICDQIEAALAADEPKLQVMLHVEPDAAAPPQGGAGAA